MNANFLYVDTKDPLLCLSLTEKGRKKKNENHQARLSDEHDRAGLVF